MICQFIDVKDWLLPAWCSYPLVGVWRVPYTRRSSFCVLDRLIRKYGIFNTYIAGILHRLTTRAAVWESVESPSRRAAVLSMRGATLSCDPQRASCSLAASVSKSLVCNVEINIMNKQWFQMKESQEDVLKFSLLCTK